MYSNVLDMRNVNVSLHLIFQQTVHINIQHNLSDRAVELDLSFPHKIASNTHPKFNGIPLWGNSTYALIVRERIGRKSKALNRRELIFRAA